MDHFEKATVFLLATNEQILLKQALDVILETCEDNDIAQIVIALKSEDCASSTYLKKRILPDKKYAKVSCYVQKKPGIVQCMSELPPLVVGSHFLMMSADNEMSPHAVCALIAAAKEHPDTIVCAAKWKRDSQLREKTNLHLIGSYLLNQMTARILHVQANDPCSIFRIYPIDVFRKLPSGRNKDFLFEYTVKPLAIGMQYTEIPTEYKNRAESESNFNYLNYFVFAAQYLRHAAQYRLLAKFGRIQ